MWEGLQLCGRGFPRAPSVHSRILLSCPFLSPSLQGGCLEPLLQTSPPQQPTATPVPTYPSQLTTTPQAPFPPELAVVGLQGAGFGAPRGAFPAGTASLALRPGAPRPQGVGPPLRLPPNQLRLQLQQRVQGPQQVS